MNRNTPFERDLEAWLQQEAPPSAPAGFHGAVMDRARTLRQRPRWAASSPAQRAGRDRGITLLAAAALLLVGGALAAASGLLRLPSVVPPSPGPSLAVLPTASPDATPAPSASPSPSPTPLSLDVTWTKLDLAVDDVRGVPPTLAWLGDRFVLRNGDGTVRTSSDGETWTVPQPGDADLGYDELSRSRASVVTSEDTIVGWWNPQDDDAQGDIAGAPEITARDTLRIVRPPAAPVDTSPFKGRIESIGVGPKGMVAQVHSDLDWDLWVTRKLGLRTQNDWTCCVRDVTFEDGVLEIKLSNGPGLKVVWADEGLEPGDYQDRGFGWYSPDGEQWTAMAPSDPPTHDAGSSLPTGTFGKVAGVADGFIATGAAAEGACADPEGPCAGMWFSSDGLTWRLLGAAPFEPRTLLPWRDGVLATDGDGHLSFWTSDGAAEIPVAAQMRGTVATGPLGLVSIGDGQVLVSRDGEGSRVSSMPAAMAGSAVIAVGDQTVVVLDQDDTLWLGTFEP